VLGAQTASLGLTIVAAIIFMGLCFTGLAIGLLITGKPKIIRGTCGYDPTKKRDGSCVNQGKCSVCSKDLSSENETKS
jgi:hypothetical protein